MSSDSDNFYTLSSSGTQRGGGALLSTAVPAGPVAGPVDANGTSGADVIDGSDLADSLSGANGDDVLWGYDGDDTLRGGAGNDLLDGGKGNDLLQDDEGQDLLRGGEGDDILLGGGLAGAGGLLDGGDGNDYLSGYDGYAYDGGAGDDVLSVAVSSQVLAETAINGSAGADRFELRFEALAKGRLKLGGGSGADTYVLSGRDAFAQGSAQLTITDFATGLGGDVLDLSQFLPYGHVGNPFATGLLRLRGEGSDTLLQIASGASFQTVLRLANVLPAMLGRANLAGGIDPDGSAVGLQLTGGAASDILIGDLLNDELRGAGGDDLLNGMSGDDLLDGGAGDDSLEGGDGNDLLLGGEGDDLLFDSSSEGDNALHGGAGNDSLEAWSTGRNLLEGGAGNDRLVGQNPDGAGYVLRGGAGDDYLAAYHGAILEGGDGDDTLVSRGGGVQLDGGNGDDILVAHDDAADILTGGAGADLVRFASSSTEYTVTRTDTGYTVAFLGDPEIGPDILTGIERLQFADVTVALDLDGAAGMAFRIYRAAFDRAPDPTGLGFWMSQIDRGTSLVEIAGGFAASREFIDLYGSAPTNAELVMRMYKNILDRDPEPGGYSFWLDVLDSKKADLATVLAAISESAENRASVTELVAGGIPYTPYG